MLMALSKKIVTLLPFDMREIIMSLYHLQYFPSLKSPKTFNEKIIHRKRNWNDYSYVECSDKIKAKEYVSRLVGNKYIIENYYIGDKISVEILNECLGKFGDLVVKTNHDSGTVKIVRQGTSESELSDVVSFINKRLESEFSSSNNERWYSKIEPKVLIERKLESLGQDELNDYKFHVFTNQKTGEQKVVLHVDYDRFSFHNRSFYNEELEPLELSCKYPRVRSTQPRPKRYSEMLRLAKEIGKKYDYVRVDLYNLDGEIYFGEMTFAHEAGWGKFNSKEHDLWLGSLWDISNNE